MNIVFHIGMGKTGTSSIQRALHKSTQTLADQNARYLGMWFDLIAPRFAGFEGLRALSGLPADEQVSHAQTFLAALRRMHEDDGITLFLHSNEAMFGECVRLRPFLERVCEAPGTSVRFLAYVRPPREWLPSAFTQWGVKHKTNKGPIEPFGIRARELIGQYNALRLWHQTFGPHLAARRQSRSTDVVADFSTHVGVRLDPPPKRQLERPEPAETVLRALYNNRFEQPVFPDAFHRAVLPAGASVPSVEAMMDTCFDHHEIDAVLAERGELFDYATGKMGLDLKEAEGTLEPPLDRDAVRERLIDYLVEITLRQGRRIQKLEADLEKLKT